MDIFYIFFLRLISYLEGNDKIIATIVMFSVLTINILWLNKLKIKLRKKDIPPLLIILYVFIHSFIFSEVTLQLLGIIFSYFLWYLFLKNKFKNDSTYIAVKFLVYSLIIYNLINFIWYKIEYSHLKTGINKTLSLFNILAYRVNFPMASGLTINSIQIGLTSLLTLYLFKNCNKLLAKLLFLILYFWNIYLLIVLDSRSPLLISLILGVLIGFGFKKIISIITRYWILLAVTAIFIVQIFYNTDIFENFKRSGELAENFFNRPKIWGLALSNTFEDLRLLFGHGINSFGGIVSSETENLHTTHNIFLQILYDFGLFGIVIMSFFIRKTMIILLKSRDINLTIIFVSFFLYGCLESVPSYYTFTVTLIFISVLVIINNKESSE